jgi:collagen type VI alpha
MRTVLFNSAVGDRPSVPNVGILVSDGHSNIYQNNTIPEAALAKAANITMLSVVITSDYDLAEMRGVSSNSGTDVFMLNNSSYTASVVNAVLNRLCSIR